MAGNTKKSASSKKKKPAASKTKKPAAAKTKKPAATKTKKPVTSKTKAPGGSKATTSLAWSVNPLPGAKQYVNSVAISADASVLIAGTYFFDYSPAGHSISGKKSFTVGVF